ncbi:hypothetical protein RRG08_029341 [Elysia crispata]|uniref:Uncharacterized protein n=1 Tax=Elysia crispata TaxID=231223 RepID=A0AAE1E386_9GAST|nr:hypothetical protein RRG08_029341 [Elysia crispata]
MASSTDGRSEVQENSRQEAPDKASKWEITGRVQANAPDNWGWSLTARATASEELQEEIESQRGVISGNRKEVSRPERLGARLVLTGSPDEILIGSVLPKVEGGRSEILLEMLTVTIQLGELADFTVHGFVETVFTVLHIQHSSLGLVWVCGEVQSSAVHPTCLDRTKSCILSCSFFLYNPQTSKREERRASHNAAATSATQQRSVEYSQATDSTHDKALVKQLTEATLEDPTEDPVYPLYAQHS